MKSAALLLFLLLSACTVSVPVEYKDHPCVDFCYITSSEGIYETFVGIYELERDLLDTVNAPVCRSLYETDATQEEIDELLPLLESGIMGLPGGGVCKDILEFCDCEMNHPDYTYSSDIWMDWFEGNGKYSNNT